MKHEIKFSGVGMHSGRVVNVRIFPSKKPGIFFRRVDLPGRPFIPATWDRVQNTGLMSTSVGRAPETVQTIEHFMAALFVCGITHAVVEIDGPEFPIMDGGAKRFIEILSKSFDPEFRGVGAPTVGKHKKGFKVAERTGFGTYRTERPMKQIIVKKEIVATRREIIRQMPLLKRAALWLHGLKTGRKEDGFVKLSPDSRGLVIDVTLDYPDKIIGIQRTELVFDGAQSSCEKFTKQFANSRTFGRLWEWEYLKKRGMGLGATENNVLVLMQDEKDWDNLNHYTDNETQLKKLLKNRGAGTLTPLHYKDEFVRHKMIDTIGDMYTSGGMIVGKMKSYKGSHALNNLILKKLFSDPSNYEIKN
ncbi:MAG: UDP-3-O-acyl-N-acetylglucosamine deacetylase [Proteobacteria bacterium]|nr:UDP-3-O-acyl-N-acetylglucosamine deacetylase [Pseudomonadota bacterium]